MKGGKEGRRKEREEKKGRKEARSEGRKMQKRKKVVTFAKADQDKAFVSQQIFGTRYLVIRTAMAVMQLFLCALFVK
jgi:hypothetical protein